MGSALRSAAPEPVLHWGAVTGMGGGTRAAWALHPLLLLQLHWASSSSISAVLTQEELGHREME